MFHLTKLVKSTSRRNIFKKNYEAPVFRGQLTSFPRQLSTWEDVGSKLIADLEKGSPVSAVYLPALSQLLSITLRILDRNGEAVDTFGDFSNSLEIEYSKQGPIGHFYPPGDPFFQHETQKGRMNCLFDSICFLSNSRMTGQQLRSLTVNNLQKNFSSFVETLPGVYKKRRGGRGLCGCGGVRYDGRNADDAAQVLDRSQGVRSDVSGAPGHPRSHALNTNGEQYSVVDYSRGGWKSGFMSYRDQDETAHTLLRSDFGQMAIEKLNYNSNKEVIEVHARELGIDKRYGVWENGQKTSEGNMSDLVMVMEHHYGEKKNREAPPHIRTFYPKKN